jgi:amino acid transporter
MEPNRVLSLPAAVLVNINIMIGSGIFINTVLLAQSAGAYGALAYLMMGALLSPLLLTFVYLMRLYKGGSFYEFGAGIHPLAGFFSSWSYFIAKLGSATIGIHVFCTLVQQVIPWLRVIPILWLDGALVLLFTMLNMLNVSIGRTIQYGFLSVKSLPIFFAIGVGLYLFTPAHFVGQTLEWTHITQSLPFVLYAFTGFEACCSLSRAIQEPGKSGPKALMISYTVGVIIVVLYQLMFFGALGPQLASLANYSQAYPALLQKLFSADTPIFRMLFFILNLGIATSSLGAAYGIIYSNSWNLFVLAEKNHIFASRFIGSLNRYKAPFVCIIAEGIFIGLYILLFRGYQVPLQQICSLGMIITYATSALALGLLSWRRYSRFPVISICALMSCLLLLWGYKDNIMIYGAWPTLYFGSILALGVGMFLIKRLENKSLKGRDVDQSLSSQ